MLVQDINFFWHTSRKMFVYLGTLKNTLFFSQEYGLRHKELYINATLENYDSTKERSVVPLTVYCSTGVFAITATCHICSLSSIYLFGNFKGEACQFCFAKHKFTCMAYRVNQSLTVQ
jgi:hypothetical protein